jgi:hypothetical protein
MKALHKFARMTVLLFAVAIAGCGWSPQLDLEMRRNTMAPALLPVEKTASIESAQDMDASPATGGQLLNETVAAYPDLAPVVKEHGTPDAVEVNLNRVALYYRNPRRTPSSLYRSVRSGAVAMTPPRSHPGFAAENLAIDGSQGAPLGS